MADELKKALDCKLPVSHGFGEGTGERGTFIVIDGKLEPFDPKAEARRLSAVEAPSFVRDEILDGVHSMLDDKIYYSRSAYLNSLKDAGYEVTGGDHLKQETKLWTPDEEKIRETAEKAYHDIKNDRVEISEESKELNKREEEQWDLYKKRQKTNWAR